MERHYRRTILAALAAAALALLAGAGLSATPVMAASGNIYSCTINRCYSHPVTGEIEDSGGSASYATGQGMVEGAVYSSGMLEVTDSGEYYLTFRMSLVDYTSDHSFKVQSVGASGWSSTGMAVTGTGSDSNGTTADVCIQVPSESCIVRGSMYVEPMGRSVIFYLYPSDYTVGAPSGMNATMVTSQSGAETTAAASSETTDSGDTAGTDSASAETTETSAAEADAETEAATLSSTLSTTAAASDASSGAELNGTAGLSLSTESEVSVESTESGTETDWGTKVFTVAAAVTVSGWILMITAAFIVYYFRRNWKRWGGAEDDDDEDE